MSAAMEIIWRFSTFAVLKVLQLQDPGLLHGVDQIVQVRGGAIKVLVMTWKEFFQSTNSIHIDSISKSINTFVFADLLHLRQEDFLEPLNSNINSGTVRNAP